MAKRFETALIITGDGSGGTKAIKLTREQLEKLSKTGKTTKRSIKGMNNELGTMRGKLAAIGNLKKTLVGGIIAGSVAGGIYVVRRALASVEGAATDLNSRMAITEQIIRSTGGAAALSGEQLYQNARRLGFATLESTKNIQESQNILLTFKSVSGSTFKRATELALDLATVTKTDLKSSMTQLGKALEDPVKGITALARSGVSFTQSQKDVIKHLVETNQKAKAQKLILDELATQYGGTAKAAAGGFAGLKDTFGQYVQEFKEQFGQAITTSKGLLAGFYKGGSAAFKFMGENINEIIFGVKTAAYTFTAILIPSIVKAGLAMTKAFAKNPLGLIVTGIILASSYLASYSQRLFTVGKTTATVGEWMGGTWDYVSDKFEEMSTKVEDKTVWDTLAGYIAQVPQLAREHVNRVIGMWVGSYKAIKLAWSGLPVFFGEIFKKAMFAAASMVNSRINSLIAPINALRKVFKQDPIDIGFKLPEDGDLSKISDHYSQIGVAVKDALNTDYIEEAKKGFIELLKPVEKYAAIRHGLNTIKPPEPPVKPDMPALLDNVADKTGKLAKKSNELSTAQKLVAKHIANVNSLLQSAKEKFITLSFKSGTQDASLTKREQDRVDALAEISSQRQILINKGVSVSLVDKLTAQLKVNDALSRSNAIEVEAAEKTRTLKESIKSKVVSLTDTLNKLTMLPEAYASWKNAQDLATGATDKDVIALENRIEVAKKYKASQDAMKESQKSFVDALAGGTAGINAYFKNLIDQAKKALLQLALFGKNGNGGLLGGFDLFSGGSGGSNFFSDLLAGIPGFAKGTSGFSGGWRIVGEKGPELEATGASRIFNAQDTKSIFSGSGSAPNVKVTNNTIIHNAPPVAREREERNETGGVDMHIWFEQAESWMGDRAANNQGLGKLFARKSA